MKNYILIYTQRFAPQGASFKKFKNCILYIIPTGEKNE